MRRLTRGAAVMAAAWLSAACVTGDGGDEGSLTQEELDDPQACPVCKQEWERCRNDFCAGCPEPERCVFLPPPPVGTSTTGNMKLELSHGLFIDPFTVGSCWDDWAVYLLNRNPFQWINPTCCAMTGTNCSIIDLGSAPWDGPPRYSYQETVDAWITQRIAAFAEWNATCTGDDHRLSFAAVNGSHRIMLGSELYVFNGTTDRASWTCSTHQDFPEAGNCHTELRAITPVIANLEFGLWATICTMGGFNQAIGARADVTVWCDADNHVNVAFGQWWAVNFPSGRVGVRGTENGPGVNGSTFQAHLYKDLSADYSNPWRNAPMHMRGMANIINTAPPMGGGWDPISDGQVFYPVAGSPVQPVIE